METLPSITPCTHVWNTRIPVAWYHVLKGLAEEAKMSVHGYVQHVVRTKLSMEQEQRAALDDGITVTNVRQRTLMEAVPSLPRWEIPVKRLRRNTPTDLADPERKTSLTNNPDPPRRFVITVPVSQHVFYGIKRLAGLVHIDEEELARHLITQSYNLVKDGMGPGLEKLEALRAKEDEDDA